MSSSGFPPKKKATANQGSVILAENHTSVWIKSQKKLTSEKSYTDCLE